MVKRKVKKAIRWCLLLFTIVFGWWLIQLIWLKPLNIEHFYARIFVKAMLDEPELLSQIRIFERYGLHFHNDDLTDISAAAQKKKFRFLRKELGVLKSYSLQSQTASQRLSSAILRWYLENELRREKFMFHNYPVNPTFGVHLELPEMLAHVHQVHNARDAKNYLARLSKVAWKISQLIDILRTSEKRGILPPHFIIKKSIDGIRKFVGKDVKNHILYTSFAKKLKIAKDLKDTQKALFLRQAATVIKTSVYKAYHRLVLVLEKQMSKATNDAGVWKLPNGKAYYQYLLRSYTTTIMKADEIHKVGLEEVSRIELSMQKLLEQQGFQGKPVGQLLRELSNKDQYLFSQTPKGRKECLEYCRSIVQNITAEIGKYFRKLPTSKVQVKAVPTFKEKSAPFAYYRMAPMDGSAAATFYVNLGDLKNTPKFDIRSIVYHEAIPGHHFQIGLQQEMKGVPFFRKLLPFSAYAEGWALYAEKLAAELGFHKKPLDRLGQLRAELLRAVRLVVDTGIHEKKWSREKAIKYMMKTLGYTRKRAIPAVERYIVMPGQACTYKVGELKILQLRALAKKSLGKKFSLKDFHHVVLKNGSLPLEILEKRVRKHIASKQNS